MIDFITMRERHNRDDNYLRGLFDERVLAAHEDRATLLHLVDYLQKQMDELQKILEGN